jgi:hypothetical protein
MSLTGAGQAGAAWVSIARGIAQAELTCGSEPGRSDAEIGQSIYIASPLLLIFGEGTPKHATERPRVQPGTAPA